MEFSYPLFHCPFKIHTLGTHYSHTSGLLNYFAKQITVYSPDKLKLFLRGLAVLLSWVFKYKLSCTFIYTSTLPLPKYFPHKTILSGTISIVRYQIFSTYIWTSARRAHKQHKAILGNHLPPVPADPIPNYSHSAPWGSFPASQPWAVLGCFLPPAGLLTVLTLSIHGPSTALWYLQSSKMSRVGTTQPVSGENTETSYTQKSLFCLWGRIHTLLKNMYFYGLKRLGSFSHVLGHQRKIPGSG